MNIYVAKNVLQIHSKITFSIARNVIMIGLLSNVEVPRGTSTFDVYTHHYF
jgi:hypothetical protein